MDVKWNEAGLAPVVVVDRLTGEVRMLAWANEEALETTLSTGKGTFFSRSRNALWRKGDSSGNTLEVTRVLVDCDSDAIVYEVDPHGPTCHTNAPSCFFHVAKGEAGRGPFLVALDELLEERKRSTSDKSYVKSLYDGGAPKMGAKIREEADELARAVADESDDHVLHEAADLLFHAMVALRSRGLSMRDVIATLSARFGTGGHEEKKRRSPV